MSRTTNMKAALGAMVVAVALASPAAAGWSGGAYGTSANIVDRLERAGKFSILLEALKTANLKDTLANEGPFTLFAPTDDAFVALLSEFNLTAEDLLASPGLPEILLYHVAGGSLGAGELLRTSTQITLSNGQPVLVVLEGLKVKVNRSNVIRANVRAGNGVIHYLDRVLLAPSDPIAIESLVDVLRLDGRFTVLLAALDRASLDDVLATGGPFTLFAPTDDAFAALLDRSGATAEELLNDPSLSDILLYHVAEGRKGAFELLSRGRVGTLEGGELNVRLRTGGVFVNNSKVINANINAPNGLIHTIDAVLVP